MIEDRDSPPPLQGESRSRSSTTHPRVIIQPLEPVGRWTVDGSGTMAGLGGTRSLAAQWLSAMLINGHKQC